MIPVKTGIQDAEEENWIPACAGMTDRRTRMRRVDCLALLYSCLPDYGNIGVQRAKNVGSFFVMKGSKKFVLLISGG